MGVDDDLFEGWAAQEAGSRLSPWTYTAKPLGTDDIEIDVLANGVCHTDCHMVNNDWGVTTFPLIPGHEVIGKVTKIGANVTHLKVGDRVGYGWLVGSCGACKDCLKGEENLCTQGYQGTILGGNQGGFQKRMRASSHFAYKIPESLATDDAAPLMCAGITVFTPLREHVTAPGMKVAVLAIGGLGHLALQFANKMGAEVTALSHSPSKKEEALALGAHHYLITEEAAATHKGEFDIIINTAPVPMDINLLLDLLGPGGKLVYVGLPATSLEFNVPKLVFGGKSIVGSIVGGRRFTSEMLEFAALHGIKPKVELLPLSKVNEAFERVLANKPRYRIVLKPDELQPEA
eukprot:jgi/Botrbrau1/15126/Bobra.0283s0005.1